VGCCGDGTGGRATIIFGGVFLQKWSYLMDKACLWRNKLAFKQMVFEKKNLWVRKNPRGKFVGKEKPTWSSWNLELP
jgi:hypothetical protein